jgi:hypothetical protein
MSDGEHQQFVFANLVHNSVWESIEQAPTYLARPPDIQAASDEARDDLRSERKRQRLL